MTIHPQVSWHILHKLIPPFATNDPFLILKSPLHKKHTKLKIDLYHPKILSLTNNHLSSDSLTLSYGHQLQTAASSVASPICQKGQSERTFPLFHFLPLFPDFLPLFPNFWQFFCCQGAHCPPWPPSGYATDCSSKFNNFGFSMNNGIQTSINKLRNWFSVSWESSVDFEKKYLKFWVPCTDTVYSMQSIKKAIPPI